jgi:hypothetical protein
MRKVKRNCLLLVIVLLWNYTINFTTQSHASCFCHAPAALALRCSTTFATSFRSQIPVDRKTSHCWGHGTPTFSPRVGGKDPILREAAFFVRDVGTALSGDLPPLVDIHGCEATQSGT